MKKKISKRKQKEREERLNNAKNQRLVLLFSCIPSFAFTTILIVFYSINKYGYPWLSLTTSLSWLVSASVFVYAKTKKWGFTNKNGVVTDKSYSVVTVYNIVLLFVLAALFAALFIKDLII